MAVVPPAAAGSGSPWRRGMRTLTARRRPAAAALAGIAVLLIGRSLSPPEPATTTVLVAAHDLPAGRLLVSDDLRPSTVPVDAAPAGALASASEALGRVLVTPLTSGEAVSSTRLAGPSSLAVQVKGLGAALHAVPVRLADAGSTALLRPGDHVDVWATPPTALDAAGSGPPGQAQARRVAIDVTVVAVPAPARDGGLLGGSTPDSATGGLVLLAVPEAAVRELVGAAAVERLGVAVRPA